MNFCSRGFFILLAPFVVGVVLFENALAGEINIVDSFAREVSGNPLVGPAAGLGPREQGEVSSAMTHFISCLPPAALNANGKCQVAGGEVCRGARKSEVSGLLECWQDNGFFALVDENGKRATDFHASATSQGQFHSVESLKTENSEAVSGSNIYQVRSGDDGSTQLVKRNGEILIPEHAMGCQKYVSSGSGQVSCLSSSGKKIDQLGLDDLKNPDRKIGLETAVDAVSIDLCLNLVSQKLNKSKSPGGQSDARVKGLLTFGDQFSFAKGQVLKVSVTTADPVWPECKVNGKKCHRILVKNKKVDCYENPGILTPLFEGEQSVQLRADFLQKEVLNSKDESISLKELLSKTRGSRPVLSMQKPLSQVLRDSATRPSGASRSASHGMD